MEQKILNWKIWKYQIKVLTRDVDLKYGNILDFKVTYKDNGLRLPGTIPSQTRNRKQTNPMRYVK